MMQRRRPTSMLTTGEPRPATCRGAGGVGVVAGLLLSVLACSGAGGAEVAEAQRMLRAGKYAEAVDACAKAIADAEWGEGWWQVKARGELTLGRYADALKTFEAALERYPSSVQLRLLGYDVMRANDRPDDADALLLAIGVLAERAPWRYNESHNRVAIGRAVLKGGADARQVLETYFDKAKRDDPDSPDAFVASGELALEKHDFALAAEVFRDALKRDPDDPDAHFGLARAYDADAERASAALAKALELNPRHVDALLLRADNLIDREDAAGAESVLKQVLEINPKHPRAWALRAVLAHLAGDRAAQAAHRDEALSSWKSNPEVDHAIGLKLSQNYRFAEGEAFQRASLAFNPSYRPAKVQLCQDLLRLGKEHEGWELAAQNLRDDPYDVVAFNLVTLHDTLGKFRTLEDDHFLVRMDPREADVYGPRVLRLLNRARTVLCERYGVELPTKTIVEIFPRQQDFAIRTFGLPGGAGFLGVCFGPVVTVNSPASRGAHPANWEAILWHEFCHSVTLHKTRNKMPRWLSEGISVHEERRELPAWGQSMTPQYRALILAGGAAPVSQLSGAFLKPPSPMHLQFAYYESSMVVEHVVARFGPAAIGRVLDELADDVPINVALAKHTEPIEQLDANFEKYLRELAEKLGGPKVDWEQPDLPLDAGSAAMAAWNKEHPDSFFGLLGEGRALLAERKFREAVAPLQKAASLHPAYGEAGGPFLLLAQAHRELGDAAAERAMLERHVALDADAIEPRMRLMELATSARDWKAVRSLAEQVLAVNPLVPAPHRFLARAAEAAGDRRLAMEGHRTLLLLDPLDRAEHHYRLAGLLNADGDLPSARREVVRALEEAPRFRDAHRLLLEIADKMDAAAPGTPAAPATRPATAPASPDASASTVKPKERQP